MSDPVRCTMLEKELPEFFLLNGMYNISQGALWGAHKAVIRCKLIQLASQLKRERQVDIDKLEKEFKLHCKMHKRNPTPSTLAKLDMARLALNLALTTAVENILRW